jgi:uncharacterized Zn finger protein
LDGGVVWFSDADLRELAGARSYQRGTGYLDAILSVSEVPGGVVGTVQGTGTYVVRLGKRGRRLTGDCSCPYGQDGAFCKHCVAVGLRLLDGPAGTDAEPLTSFLSSLGTEGLVDLILAEAALDPDLYQRLLHRATAGTADPEALDRILDGLRVRGAPDYSSAIDYADKAHDALDTLASLLPGHVATAEPLIRTALERITHALGRADDSAGAIGDAASRALALYAQACATAPPDPQQLARWLIRFQLSAPDWPQVDIALFRDALGERGMTAYRQQVQQLAKRSEPAATGLREDLARADGDVDALVAVYAEDLGRPGQYVRIAEALIEAGRTADALDWAERGASRDTGSGRWLDELLASLYEQAGRHGDALAVRKRSFEARADPGTYGELRSAAQRAGQWDDTREWALAVLRRGAARGGYAADPLIRVLLAEDDVDGAWAAVAEFGCTTPIRLEAAARRGSTHPADAIGVYIAAIDEVVELKTPGAYQRAAELIGTLRILHERAGRDFRCYLDPFKDVHRRKRRFLDELGRAGL